MADDNTKTTRQMRPVQFRMWERGRRDALDLRKSLVHPDDRLPESEDKPLSYWKYGVNRRVMFYYRTTGQKMFGYTRKLTEVTIVSGHLFVGSDDDSNQCVEMTSEDVPAYLVELDNGELTVLEESTVVLSLSEQIRDAVKQGRFPLKPEDL